MPFFSDFSPKNHCSRAHILSKKVHSLKIKLLSCPYFVRKTSILSKTQCSHVIFFQIFHEKSHAVKPIFGQINVNSVKNTLYYLSKKSIWCPFLPIFLEKKTALMPIFCQKNGHALKNKLVSCPYFKVQGMVQKLSNSDVGGSENCGRKAPIVTN